MALQFICNTCDTKYSAEITENRMIYIDANKRIDLKSENQDCYNCKSEIEKEAGNITEQARAKIRAKKQHG